MFSSISSIYRSLFLTLVPILVPWLPWDLYMFLLIYTKNQPSVSKYAIHGSYGVRSPCFSTVFCFWHRSAVDLQCFWCSNESPAKWCNLGQALQNEATHPPLRGVFEAPYISVLGKKSVGLFFHLGSTWIFSGFQTWQPVIWTSTTQSLGIILEILRRMHLGRPWRPSSMER